MEVRKVFALHAMKIEGRRNRRLDIAARPKTLTQGSSHPIP
jgi:hypothetical protein